MNVQLRVCIGSRGSQHAQFKNPYFVAADRHGNVYVSDCDNHRIQIFHSDGSLKATFGSKGTACGQFRFPHGIAVDSHDNIIVADGDNQCIKIFDSSLNYVRSLGCNGNPDVRLDSPCGIALDGKDNIYAIDSNNHRILIFSPDGTLIKVVGAGYEGKGWRHGGTSHGELNTPCDLAIDKHGKIYVTDEYNHRVQVFSNEGQFLFAFGSRGSAPGQFIQPEGIAVTDNGQVIVCDSGNAKLQLFSASDGAYLELLVKGDHNLKWPSGIAKIGRAHV